MVSIVGDGCLYEIIAIPSARHDAWRLSHYAINRFTDGVPDEAVYMIISRKDSDFVEGVYDPDGGIWDVPKAIALTDVYDQRSVLR